MENCLKVYPKRGFLNTEYKVRSENRESFSVLFNGQKMYDGEVQPGEIKVLPKLRVAGEYIIINNRTNERQSICVEDALRLGSSNLKRAYVFDDFPYIIFVMKDRIHFYDPSIETYVFTENYLSPDEIKHIVDGKLLFFTKHSEGTSLSVFNTERLCIENTLEVGEILAESKNNKKLYVLDKSGSIISVVNTKDLSIEIEFQDSNQEGQNFYYVDKENNLLYIFDENNFYSIAIDTNDVREFEKIYVVGITSNGYLFKYNYSEYKYEYLDLKSKFSEEYSFKYNPFIAGFRIEGFVIENSEWLNRHNSKKNKDAIYEMSDEFVQECRAKIANGDDSLCFKRKIKWDDTNLSIEFHPSGNGIYILEKWERNVLHEMSYDKRYDRVSRPRFYYRRRILWTSNEGYETTYSTGKDSSYSNDILIKGNKALLRVNSSLYIMLRNGIVVSKYTDANETADFATTPKNNEEPIIIGGSKISTSKVICRSDRKLVCKNKMQYILYELSDKSEWQEVKTIDLKEEMHDKAKISHDGKYLVYSKGGNKYALFNIQEQKEETVLTGNFVDFDKTGNLLFLEDANGRRIAGRELRIYNPVSFQWEKSNAQYYNFISPDGKLYAKTGLKTRYFNKLTEKEITKEEYFGLRNEYDTSGYVNYSDEEKTAIKNKRKEFILKNRPFFEKYSGKNKLYEGWIDDIQKWIHLDFCSYFLYIKQYVVIGIVGESLELDIELNSTLSFLNYVAFSYDNKYIGIVGKPGNNGYLKLVKINYDAKRKSLSLERQICDTEIARKATWICAFTKNGLFGTYDSTPDLYLIDQNDFEKFTSGNVYEYKLLKEDYCINDRSLLCFSPSGKLMALSNQGYEAKSLGGIGHVPSNDIYIYDTENRTMKAHWNDHGDKVAYKNVANAGFSFDESKLMTVSVDGVIVVRNIKEAINDEDMKNSEETLAIAS